MDSLNKTRSLFYIKVHESKKALSKDIGPVNRVHLTVLVMFMIVVELPAGEDQFVRKLHERNISVFGQGKKVIALSLTHRVGVFLLIGQVARMC